MVAVDIFHHRENSRDIGTAAAPWHPLLYHMCLRATFVTNHRGRALGCRAIASWLEIYWVRPEKEIASESEDGGLTARGVDAEDCISEEVCYYYCEEEGASIAFEMEYRQV